MYDRTPGLTSDKLKAVLELVWSHLQDSGLEGIVLAYDEAQNLSDQAARHQYPLSLLLDVFQSIQKTPCRKWSRNRKRGLAGRSVPAM